MVLGYNVGKLAQPHATGLCGPCAFPLHAAESIFQPNRFFPNGQLPLLFPADYVAGMLSGILRCIDRVQKGHVQTRRLLNGKL